MPLSFPRLVSILFASPHSPAPPVSASTLWHSCSQPPAAWVHASERQYTTRGFPLLPAWWQWPHATRRTGWQKPSPALGSPRGARGIVGARSSFSTNGLFREFSHQSMPVSTGRIQKRRFSHMVNSCIFSRRQQWHILDSRMVTLPHSTACFKSKRTK